MLSLALLASFAGFAAFSAFTNTVTGADNQFSTGSINLTTNDALESGFAMSDMIPGDTKSECVTVGYTGSNNSDITLAAADDSAGGLGSYLDATVTSGHFSTTPAGNGDCTGFVASTAGVGDVYSGASPSFGGFVSAGPLNLTATNGDTPWQTGDTNAYMVTVTLPNTADITAESLIANLQLTWNATATNSVPS